MMHGRKNRNEQNWLRVANGLLRPVRLSRYYRFDSTFVRPLNMYRNENPSLQYVEKSKNMRDTFLFCRYLSMD